MLEGVEAGRSARFVDIRGDDPPPPDAWEDEQAVLPVEPSEPRVEASSAESTLSGDPAVLELTSSAAAPHTAALEDRPAKIPSDRSRTRTVRAAGDKTTT